MYSTTSITTPSITVIKVDINSSSLNSFMITPLYILEQSRINTVGVDCSKIYKKEKSEPLLLN